MKSKGLGDDIEKITKITGIKKIVEKINKGSCISCGNRQEGWNLRFPHKK